MLYALILACEVTFWLTLIVGLALRYLLHRPRIGRLVLLCVPLIDLALLTFSWMDLKSGAAATFAHGLAIAYVAFTVAFGSVVLRWMDARFARRYGHRVHATSARQTYWGSVRHEIKLWLRCIAAAVITYALLFSVVAWVDDASRTKALELWFRIPLGTVFLWFVFGPLWQVVSFKKSATTQQAD